MMRATSHLRRVLAPPLCATMLLAGCVAPGPAPVIERDTRPPAPAATPIAPGSYMVQRGDTLSSIARAHRVEVRDLLSWNTIDNPNALRVGQVLRVAPPAAAMAAPAAPGEVGPAIARPIQLPGTGEARSTEAVPSAAPAEGVKREPKGGKQPYSDQAWARAQRGEDARKPAPEAAPAKGEPAPESKPAAKPDTKPEDKPAKPADAPADAISEEGGVSWSWPAHGRVIAEFNDATNKGIDIGGRTGEPVYAAASGKVVYAGSGLRGYGKLVVVKHNGTYLSAYAHNSKLLVEQGQKVTRGQKIAELGDSDADRAKLHFEIRRQGKPVDPLKYLPSR